MRSKNYRYISIILFFFAFICMTLAENQVYAENVSVGLKVNVSSIKIKSSKGFKGDRRLDSSTHVIKASPAGLVVNDRVTGANSWILKPSVGHFTLNGRRYRGVLKIDLRNGRLNAVNMVDIEEYLLGVVPREMLSRSPVEALKAQAVVARTWVYRNRGKHSSKGYEVCATTCCQVYGGLDSEDPRVEKAVKATRGIVILHENRPANTPYHSNCGGHTANNDDVWNGAPVPYLRGVKCTYCFHGPHRTWRVELDPQTLGKKLKDLKGPVAGISLIESDSSGRVKKMEIRSTNGDSIRITGHRLRLLAGADLVWSTLFTMSAGQDEPIIREDEEDPISSILEQLKAKQNLTNTLRKIISGRKIVLSGRGFGHGVGLCQEGAIGMAEMGYDFKDIIRFYYKGISLKEISG